MQNKKRKRKRRRKPKMIALQWIRFLIGMAFLICGVIVFGIEIYGVFKFKYVLNRMHSAAMGDTLGIGLSMLGLIILCGINFTSVKMLLVIIFLWFASPVASHTVARFEVATNEEPDKDFEKKELEN
jgi:multicomponent Na+:H+ antiporter subunit G